MRYNKSRVNASNEITLMLICIDPSSAKKSDPYHPFPYPLLKATSPIMINTARGQCEKDDFIQFTMD
jgi:hypothetical protein